MYGKTQGMYCKWIKMHYLEWKGCVREYDISEDLELVLDFFLFAEPFIEIIDVHRDGDLQ